MLALHLHIHNIINHNYFPLLTNSMKMAIVGWNM